MLGLKTLKDLDSSDEYCKWGCDSYQHFSRDLRQEAIKWIKEIKIDNGCFDLTEEQATDCIKNWIKHFFNITEEEIGTN